MLERFLLLWLVISSWVALKWPSDWPDPFTSSAPWLPWIIVLTMLSIGLMLPREEVNNVLRGWPVVFGGTAIQYAAMPLLAFLCGTVFALEGDHFVGVILVGCVPGAMASNVLTINAGGNASYSVSLTTAATLVSPLAVPLALGVTLGAWDEQQIGIFGKSALFMIWTVVTPVVIGHLISRWLARYERAFRRVAPAIANLAILWIIAVVVALNRQQLSDVPQRLLSALVVLNVCGYLGGYFGSHLLHLPTPMRKALTLEIGMQNAGLGATLATHLFQQITALLGRERLDELLFRGRQHPLQTDDEQVADQMCMDVLGCAWDRGPCAPVRSA